MNIISQRLILVKRAGIAALSFGIFFASMAAPAYAQTVTAQTIPAPISNLSGSASSNWSGYSAQNGSYTSVSGTWTIPTVPADAGTSLAADATWVGIGGISSKDLIQAGTQAIVQNGTVQYQAWYELLPAGQVFIPVHVHPGDSVTASFVETAQNVWHLWFVNNTTHITYQTDISYVSSNSSAEWIEEMPVGESGTESTYVPLDQFGTVQFTNASAMQNGTNVSLTGANAQPIVMKTEAREILAEPSTIGSDSQSFSVTRTDTPVTDVTVGEHTQRWHRDGETVGSFAPGVSQSVSYYVRTVSTQGSFAPVITRNGNSWYVQFSFGRRH